MIFFTRAKPKIKIQTTKRDGYSGWLKCTHCTELIHTNELEQNSNCCPKCDYHYRLSAEERVKSLADHGTFCELFQDVQPQDLLKFFDSESYTDRLKSAREKSGRDEAIIVGTCSLSGFSIALGVLDFNFMGGS